jgi:hypothetical protein
MPRLISSSPAAHPSPTSAGDVLSVGKCRVDPAIRKHSKANFERFTFVVQTEHFMTETGDAANTVRIGGR